jgi:signal peptidase II
MTFLFYSAVACAIFAIDRWTKLWALTQCVQPKLFNQYFSCALTFNRGISWGVFHSDDSHVFVMVSGVIAIITVSLAFYAFIRYEQKYSILGETLIIAGSLSNIFDRFYYKGVVDFIEFSYADWVWPSFNVADSCIVLGVIIMLWQSLRSS